MDWSQWIAHHASLFGMNADDDKAMLLAWVDLFAARGFTADELRRASDEYALAPSAKRGKYRTEHPPALEEIAHRHRQARRAREDPEAVAHEGWCSLCRDTGHVEVPWAGLFRGGGKARRREPEDSEHLGMVYCSCRVGRRMRHDMQEYLDRLAQSDAARYANAYLVTFEEYSQRCPYWRERLADIRERQRLRQRSRALAETQDRQRGELPRGVTLAGDALPRLPFDPETDL